MGDVLPQPPPTLSTEELILRVVVAGVLGGLIGFERELGDQPAGFRTHILVSLGAALFTLVGAYGVAPFVGGATAGVRFDPTRVAAQVVTGIGFLGAGAILRHGLTVRGLTTAAALWVTAALGMAAALGYWVGALATTVTTLAALYGLKRVERMIVSRLKRGQCEFVFGVGSDLRLTELTTSIESHGARLDTMRFVEEDGARHLVASVGLPPHVPPERLAQAASDVQGVTSASWRS